MGRKKTASQLYVLTIGHTCFALPPDAALTTVLDTLQRAIQVEPDYMDAERLFRPSHPTDRVRIELALVPADRFRADLAETEDGPLTATCRPHSSGRDLVPARPRVNGHASRRLFAEE